MATWVAWGWGYVNPTGEGQRYCEQHVLKWILYSYIHVYSLCLHVLNNDVIMLVPYMHVEW